jgi:hypothetical protein
MAQSSSSQSEPVVNALIAEKLCVGAGMEKANGLSTV